MDKDFVAEKARIETRDLLVQMAENLDKIAKNTKSPGLTRRIFEWTALIVGISGVLTVIEQVIQWVK